ncbi:MAG: M67 family metallopeptidase [Myxococcota bacterium]
MPTGQLTLSADALAAMDRHAAAGYPHEVVGVMAGRGGRVERIAALVNERADRPQDRYQVSGLAVQRAEQALEAEGFEILGYYHTHPDHPARYSDTDRDQALPNLSYLILSIVGGARADVRAWRLREDRTAMDEQPVTFEESR